MKTLAILLIGLSASILGHADTLLVSYAPFNAPHQIHAYSTSGMDLGVFTSVGLHNPMGMAVDKDRSVVVSNYDNHTVTRYSSSGDFLGILANTGLTNPIALAYDSSGSLFVANMRGNNVTKYSPSGAYLGIFATASLWGPSGLAFEPEGRLFVANNLGNTITKYSITGDFLGTFAQTVTPAGICFDASTNLYVANEFGLGTVQRFAVDGFATTFSGFGQPMDVKVDGAGDIWVLDAGANAGGERPRVFQYSPAWEPLHSFPVRAALAVNAFIIQSPQAPRLSIALAGDQVVLSWPTNATGFALQQSDDLARTNWTTLPVTNSTGAVLLSPTNAQSFFRLRSP